MALTPCTAEEFQFQYCLSQVRVLIVLQSDSGLESWPCPSLAGAGLEGLTPVPQPPRMGMVSDEPPVMVAMASFWATPGWVTEHFAEGLCQLLRRQVT